MATTYAAYANILHAEKANATSRRASHNSTTSTTSTSSSKSRISLKNALEQLRPTTEVITPAGIYSPIIKKGALFSGLKPAKEVQEPTPIYASLTQRDRPLFGLSKKSKKGEKRGSTSTSTRNPSLTAQSASTTAVLK